MRPASHALRPDADAAHRSSALARALVNNRKWAADIKATDPTFLPTIAKGQSPSILWLGCSDSRTPETTILGFRPGDVFSHRNIANIINPTDISLLSVVEYAVAQLTVTHIVVCGHTSCGGVAATLGNGKLGVIDVWLQPMRMLRERHAAELAKLEGAAKTTAMSKINVQAGVEVLRRIPTVLHAIRDRGLKVHGLIYDLDTGLLEEVDCGEPIEMGAARETAFEYH
ncbi:hypothetical protein LTR08_001724 [Meristemomyces frigidus]|nr:hypothetical protein LTR08_001724 [Meristemomyces frigidus]